MARLTQIRRAVVGIEATPPPFDPFRRESPTHGSARRLDAANAKLSAGHAYDFDVPWWTPTVRRTTNLSSHLPSVALPSSTRPATKVLASLSALLMSMRTRAISDGGSDWPREHDARHRQLCFRPHHPGYLRTRNPAIAGILWLLPILAGPHSQAIQRTSHFRTQKGGQFLSDLCRMPALAILVQVRQRVKEAVQRVLRAVVEH